MKEKDYRNSSAKDRQKVRSKKSPVEIQRKNNGKQLGGITGKGFLPGQSGNPGGRPKGSVKISSAYQRSLASFRVILKDELMPNS